MNDVLLEDFDIVLQKDGFATEESTQNLQLLLMAEKGEFKEYPLLGAGLKKYVHSTGRTQEMKREIAVQFGYDGYNNVKINITDTGQLTVEI